MIISNTIKNTTRSMTKLNNSYSTNNSNIKRRKDINIIKAT